MVVEARLDPHEAFLQRQRLQQLAHLVGLELDLAGERLGATGLEEVGLEGRQQAVGSRIVANGARGQEARATRNRLAGLHEPLQKSRRTRLGEVRRVGQGAATGGAIPAQLLECADQPRLRALELPAVEVTRSPVADPHRPAGRAQLLQQRASPSWSPRPDGVWASRASSCESASPLSSRRRWATRSGPAPCLRGAGSTTQPPPIVSGGATCRSTNRSPLAGTIGRSSLS